MRRHAAAAVLIALAAPPTARADFDPDSLKGGALLHYDVTYVDRRGDDVASRPDAERALALAGFRLRGFVSRGFPLGYLIGLDVHAGATNPTGFAYQTDLYLVGTAARLGRFGMIGAGTGVGASGAVGTIDDAVGIPVDAFLEIGLGAHVRLLGRARAVWLTGAPRRDRGARNAAWTDEVDASAAIRIGNRYREHGFPSGNGYFLGFAYRESQGAQFLGVTFGYSVDLGTR